MVMLFTLCVSNGLLKPENWKEDIKLNFKLFLNGLQKSNRFRTGLEAATQMINYQNVWLAGHSLGSSLALAVGREMTKSFKVCLETYLYNPPFISLPIDRIKSEKVKLGLRITGSLLTADLTAVVVAVAADVIKTDSLPYLFIN